MDLGRVGACFCQLVSQTGVGDGLTELPSVLAECLPLSMSILAKMAPCFFFVGGGGKKVWLECVLLVRAWCHVLANGTMLCYVTVLWWTHEDVFWTNYLSMTFFELVHQQCECPLSLSRSSFHLFVPRTWFCDQVARGASRWKQEVSAGSKSYSRGRKESGIERLACGHLLAALQDDIMDVIGELCFWYTSRHVGADCGLSAWPTRS